MRHIVERKVAGKQQATTDTATATNDSTRAISTLIFEPVPED